MHPGASFACVFHAPQGFAQRRGCSLLHAKSTKHRPKHSLRERSTAKGSQFIAIPTTAASCSTSASRNPQHRSVALLLQGCTAHHPDATPLAVAATRATARRRRDTRKTKNERRRAAPALHRRHKTTCGQDHGLLSCFIRSPEALWGSCWFCETRRAATRARRRQGHQGR